MEIQSISMLNFNMKTANCKGDFMFFRKCNICGHPMDPGEGQNGTCDDCLFGREKKRCREEELDRMVRSTDYKQMRLEEFLDG